MFSVDYQAKVRLSLDISGRPTIPITFAQSENDERQQYRVGNILLDTGATVTSLNKKVADLKKYPIIKYSEPVVMGFTDLDRAIKALATCGKSRTEAYEYLKRHRGKNLIESLRNDYSITGIGLVCDLRRVSYAVLFKYVVKDVIIATPSEDGIVITELIGMNLLEKFNFGLDVEDKWLYLSKRTSVNAHVNPDYTCGNVSLITENA
jgi:hypothetical protein